MGRRLDPVSWGSWGRDEVPAALVRHPVGSSVPTAPAPSVSARHRTGWWRCVPLAGHSWDTEWIHADGPARGAFHFRRTLRWKADTMVAEARAVLDAPPPAPAAEPPRALLTGPVRDLVAEALAAEEARAVDVEAAAPAPEPPETPAPERTYWPVPEAVAWVRANA